MMWYYLSLHVSTLHPSSQQYIVMCILHNMLILTSVDSIWSPPSPDAPDISAVVTGDITGSCSSKYLSVTASYKCTCILTGLPIGYSVTNKSPYRIQCNSSSNRSPYRIRVIVALTGLPIGYSVIVALTGLPIRYSVIVALTGLPIGYSVIVALAGLPIG